MISWRTTRICVILLGLWGGLMPAFSAAPATAISHNASMNGDVMPGGSDPCPDADKEREMCAFVCLSSPSFIAPPSPGNFFAPAIRHRPRKDASLSGRSFKPEPAPPRPHALL
jgi:hypothetical protein